ESNRPDKSVYKVRSLNKAIREIEYLERPVILEADVQQLKGVSPWLKKALITHVQNSLLQPLASSSSSSQNSFIAHTGQHQRERDEARTKSVAELHSVPSIGLTTARHLVSIGITSLQQLRTALSLTSPSSSPQPPPHLASYYEHVIQPVTRDEIDRVTTLVEELMPPGYQVVRVGAYRREFPISDRIDLLLFHPLRTPPPRRPRRPRIRTQPRRPPRVRARPRRMEMDGIVRVPEPGEELDTRKAAAQRVKAVGGCKGVYRKMDLNLVPLEARATALMFLTGDNEFVKEMKTRASRMGLFLNEFGLWRWEEGEEGGEGEEEEVAKPKPQRGRPPLRKANGTWILIPTDSEADLFAELGTSYVPPEKRNFSYLVNKANKKKPKGESNSGGVGALLGR
ncbi:hypothetical protein BDP27DRAFT_1235284, partial [Rhodocollybia butyracea]